MMRETEWKRFEEKGRHYRIRARYGMDYDFARKNNQEPYFSVTGEIEERRGTRWVEHSAGMIHEGVARHFPELEPYLRWHLTSWPSGPVHYLANARYWWEKMAGVSRWPREPGEPDPGEAFASGVVLGALAEDSMPRTDPDAWPGIKQWLEARLPHLMGLFQADMEALGVLEGTAA